MPLGREEVRARIQDAVPGLDEDMLEYCVGTVEDPGMELGPEGDELYELLSPFLGQVCEDDLVVRDLCVRLSEAIVSDKQANKPQLSKLDNSVQMAKLAHNMAKGSVAMSILDQPVERDSLVDQEKLAKAEEKRKQKLEKREQKEITTQQREAENRAREEEEQKQTDADEEYRVFMLAQQGAASGQGGTRDIKVENFDLSHYGKVILKEATVNVAYGRRYGLVGRNGIGKTTLLRAVARRELQIPTHIRIGYVEQEIAGDDTTVIEAVLSADVERARLLEQEKELTATGLTKTTAQAQQLAEIYQRLHEIDADTSEARAAVILSGLGFSPERQQWATRAFSGGWRMRIALARALFSKPDLLLLDEPTNMLDIEAVIWLETYLLSWPASLMVVSHDREFLNTVATDILHVHSQKIDSYKGNYDQFEKTKGEALLAQQREYEAQQLYRQHLQDYIDRWRYNANRAPQAQSKLKILAKLPVLRPIEVDPPVRLRFNDPNKLVPPLLQLDEVDFRYGPDLPLILRNVTLGVQQDSRMAVVGVNGAGKSTLLKILTGELSHTGGDVRRNPKLKMGYFTQHFVDQLDLKATPVTYLKNRFPGLNAEEYRRNLGAFGVTGDLGLQVIGTLSGGQKSRVAFAALSMENSHILLLDEPTNHLDMETVDALAEALQVYKGGVVLVSHDQRLISLVATDIIVCEAGTVYRFDGDFAAFKRKVAASLAK